MLGTGPRKVTGEYRLRKCSVCFREIRIQFNGGGCSFISGGGTLRERHHAKDTEPVVIICDTSVGERVSRIERDSLLVTDDRARETLFGKRVPIKTTPQIRFVRLWIVCAALRETKSLVHGQVRHDRFGDVR